MSRAAMRLCYVAMLRGRRSLLRAVARVMGRTVWMSSGKVNRACIPGTDAKLSQGVNRKWGS